MKEKAACSTEHPLQLCHCATSSDSHPLPVPRGANRMGHHTHSSPPSMVWSTNWAPALPVLCSCHSECQPTLNANPLCLWLSAGPRLSRSTASLQWKQDVCSYIFLILLLPWLLVVSGLAQALVPHQGNSPVSWHSSGDSHCSRRRGVLAPKGTAAGPWGGEEIPQVHKVSTRQGRRCQVNSSSPEEEKHHPSGTCCLCYSSEGCTQACRCR